MQVIQVEENAKGQWDNFVKSNAPDGGLLQSWPWSEFQKGLGNKVFRLALIDGNGSVVAVALLVKHELPFEYNYLYCPRGPVMSKIESKKLKALFDEIKKIAREEKSFMIRLDPPWVQGFEKSLLDAGLRRSDYEVQPKCSLLIDVSGSQEEILSSFKQKTRYNISLANRRGVKIRESVEPAEIESFWQLLKQTSQRDGFHTHLKEHYLKMFEILAKDDIVRLYFAQYDNKIIAATIVCYFGPAATYLHGASASLYRDTMSPYLLQWYSILEAKKRGCRYYDFGGINGQSYNNKKWEGITRFKTGFSRVVPPREYIGGYELIINPVVFAAYKFVKQIRG